MPVMAQYSTDGGLKIEWRDVNVYGPSSESSALAAYASRIQSWMGGLSGPVVDNAMFGVVVVIGLLVSLRLRRRHRERGSHPPPR